MFKHIIFDLDLTLVDTSLLEKGRNNRDWNLVYSLIPQTKLYDGFDNVFKIIRRHEIKVAIVTTAPKKYTEKIISFFNIPYSYIVAYHDAPPKPSPAPMLKALELMKIEPKEAISFGDRGIDIQSSNLAGVESVACLWGSKEIRALMNSNYRHAIRVPSEILTLIR